MFSIDFSQSNRRRFLAGTFTAMAGLTLTGGCQTLPTLVTCPIPEPEQAARIQDIVPVGTERRTAVEKLRDAGIGGTFSTGESIFYCSTWLQNEQERWHINVDVLFDKDGRVYAYRPDPHGPAATTAARQEEPGTATVSKPPKQVASAKQTGGVVDPFAE